MDVNVARMLAQSLKAHEREGTVTFGSAKKARVEETDPTVFHLDHPEPVLRHIFDRECFPMCIIVRENLTSGRRSCPPSL